MPIPNLFPNVPNVPGAPQIPRSPDAPTSTTPALADDSTQSVLASSANGSPLWGVFDSSGNLAINADSVRNFDWRQEYRIGNYPVQQGSFASYDKVTVPYECAVRVVCTGDIDYRSDFVSQVQGVIASLDLYTIITPEESYQNCNVTRGELSRHERNGAYVIVYDLFFQQIIQVTGQYAATANTANAQQPTAQGVVNNGQVNATTPTPAAQNAATSALNQQTQ
jgi:hypothetical protein